MLPHFHYPFDRPVSLFEHFMLDFFTKAPTTWETTSYDGRPFLTPNQFLNLSHQQERRLPLGNLSTVTPKTNRTSKNNTQKLNNKAQTNRLNKNQKDDDSDVEIIEVITKKVKTNNGTPTPNPINKIPETSKPSFICLSPSLPVKNKEIILDGAKKVQTETKSETSARTNDTSVSKKLKSIVKTIYEEGGNLRFVVKCEQEFDKKEVTVIMTREEIVSQDPMLLVYYYEKYLEFDQVPGFDPITLEKA